MVAAQTQTDTLKVLDLQLKQAEALTRIYLSKDYQEVLLPLLQAAVSNKWLDPLQYPSQEEFHRAYLQMRAKAVVCQEQMDLLASQPQRVLNIRSRMAAPTKDYAMGAGSHDAGTKRTDSSPTP